MRRTPTPIKNHHPPSTGPVPNHRPRWRRCLRLGSSLCHYQRYRRRWTSSFTAALGPCCATARIVKEKDRNQPSPLVDRPKGYDQRLTTKWGLKHNHKGHIHAWGKMVTCPGARPTRQEGEELNKGQYNARLFSSFPWKPHPPLNKRVTTPTTTLSGSIITREWKRLLFVEL